MLDIVCILMRICEDWRDRDCNFWNRCLACVLAAWYVTSVLKNATAWRMTSVLKNATAWRLKLSWCCESFDYRWRFITLSEDWYISYIYCAWRFLGGCIKELCCESCESYCSLSLFVQDNDILNRYVLSSRQLKEHWPAAAHTALGYARTRADQTTQDWACLLSGRLWCPAIWCPCGRLYWSNHLYSPVWTAKSLGSTASSFAEHGGFDMVVPPTRVWWNINYNEYKMQRFPFPVHRDGYNFTLATCFDLLFARIVGPFHCEFQIQVYTRYRKIFGDPYH